MRRKTKGSRKVKAEPTPVPVDAEFEPTADELVAVLPHTLHAGRGTVYFGTPYPRKTRKANGVPVVVEGEPALVVVGLMPCRTRAEALVLARAIELGADELP